MPNPTRKPATPARVLTVRQPYASLIVYGGKDMPAQGKLGLWYPPAGLP